MTDQNDPTIRSQNEGATPIAAPRGAVPSRIGHYRILSIIGEGGMGTVYEAEQDKPRRTVALKVIRPGLTTDELLRRFEQESQVLGRLQHLGIAQIYEAGTADAGYGPQPYFAMELVRGRTLDRHADEMRLDARERLELVARICDAVHHAHQKGVVHRDLKPGNILVDESGQPKILDFGVARATDSDIQATQTSMGTIVGTLPYMSPEQIAADPRELDTRSDVYGLGVVLYEILAKRLPYDLTRKSLAEAARVICEEEPSPLGSLQREFRGDLETITTKALDKDKERRYQSAAELAADIRHYLRDEPIIARPATASYHLRKFARRNKALVASLAASFVVLLGAAVVGGWLAVRARQAEATAKSEAAKAGAVNTFLQDMLSSVDPSKSKGREVTVRETLDEAAKTVDGGSLAAQPEVEAAVRTTIGSTYRALGLYPAAESQLRTALSLRQQRFGPYDPSVESTLNELAGVHYLKGDYASAEPLFRESLAITRRRLGDEHPEVASGLNNVAAMLQARGDFAGAEPLFRESLALWRKTLGEQSVQVASGWNNLGTVLWQRGDREGAAQAYRQSLEIQRKLTPGDDPTVASGLSNLGVLLESGGDLAGAEPLFREALAMRRKVLGGDHPQVAESMNNLGALLVNTERPAEAEPLLRECLAINVAKLDSRHPNIATAKVNLASALLPLGQLEEAERLVRQALATREENAPPEDWGRFDTRSLLGEVLAAGGRSAEAEALLLSGYEGVEDRTGIPPRRKRRILERLERFYASRGRQDEAARWRALIEATPG